MTAKAWADVWPTADHPALQRLTELSRMEVGHPHPPLVSGGVTGRPWHYVIGRSTSGYVGYYLRPHARPWSLVANGSQGVTLTAQPTHALAMMVFCGPIFRGGVKWPEFVEKWPEIWEILREIGPQQKLEAVDASASMQGWGDLRGFDYTDPAVQRGIAQHLRALDPHPDRIAAVEWASEALRARRSGEPVSPPPSQDFGEYTPYVSALLFRLLPHGEQRQRAAFYILTRSPFRDASQPEEGNLWPTTNPLLAQTCLADASRYLSEVGLPDDLRDHPLAETACRAHLDLKDVHSDPFVHASAELAETDPQASWDALMAGAFWGRLGGASSNRLENFLPAARKLAQRLGDDELAELYRTA